MTNTTIHLSEEPRPFQFFFANFSLKIIHFFLYRLHTHNPNNTHRSHPHRVWDRTCHSLSPFLFWYLFSSSHREPANMWCVYLFFSWCWLDVDVPSNSSHSSSRSSSTIVSLNDSHNREGGFDCHVWYNAELLLPHKVYYVVLFNWEIGIKQSIIHLYGCIEKNRSKANFKLSSFEQTRTCKPN